ncbi:MAG: DUF4397 domain-containing protein [Candidatus Latescibacterota bacterium]|jgi:hypothetical protein
MKHARSLFFTLILFSFVATGAMAGTARLQVIHNAADPGAANVDIYVNGTLFIDEFGFRAATPFQDVPAGVPLTIGVAPGGDSTPDDVIAEFPVEFESGETYVAVANGVLSPDDFDQSANGGGIGFDIFARDNVRESAYWRWFVKLIAFHGATDAPAVDVRIQGSHWGPLFGDLSYGQFSSYRSLLPRKYILDVTPAGSPGTVVASFEADLNGLGGGAAVVFASGFLNPAANQNGPGFGMFAALPSGAVVELPPVSQTARVQVIHNAADPAASVVDIYLDGTEIVPDFAFRAATPFVDLPAGREIVIGVAPGNSTDAGDIIAEFPVTLEAGQRYIVMANGVLDPTQYAENPEGADIAFSLYPFGGAKERSGSDYLVKLIAFHGATDAPTVDVVAQGKKWKWRLIDDLSYGQYSGYRWLLARPYTLYVTPGGDNKTVVASYEADLRGLGGGAAVVFASGFLSPGDNQSGAAFGLFVALPDGNVIELQAADPSRTMAGLNLSPTGQPAQLQTNLGQNYPNPFNPTTTIGFTLAEPASVTLSVFNAKGQLVKRLMAGEQMDIGPHSVSFEANDLASGVYFYRLRAGEFTQMKKMVLLK